MRWFIFQGVLITIFSIFFFNSWDGRPPEPIVYISGPPTIVAWTWALTRWLSRKIDEGRYSSASRWRFVFGRKNSGEQTGA